MKIMKAATLVQLTVLALVCALGAVGCRKGLQKTTTIPDREGRVGGEKPRPPIDNQAGLNTGGNPGANNIGGTPIGGNPNGNNFPGGANNTGVPLPDGDFTGWEPNRTEFADQIVHFEFDKATVRPGDVAKLEEVARRMKSSFKGKALRIEGHCDERGTEEYNRSLGDRRALSVREKLVSLGLDPQMLPTISFGEEKPTDPGHNEAAWSKNRRGELILLSPPGAK